jgi:hypothetical protein
MTNFIPSSQSTAHINDRSNFAIELFQWIIIVLSFFVVSIYLISNAYENLSVITGFPFGHYHYTGPYQIFHVPFWIGIATAQNGVSWHYVDIYQASATVFLLTMAVAIAIWRLYQFTSVGN